MNLVIGRGFWLRRETLLPGLLDHGQVLARRVFTRLGPVVFFPLCRPRHPQKVSSLRVLLVINWAHRAKVTALRPAPVWS